jgi:hypothetical protein
MASSGQPQGRYRVLLVGIGNNTEAEKESFCTTISKSYNVPLPQLRKIVERCPVVLKKDLTLKKAELLAKTFESFGALVSVEVKRESPPVDLEFQELVPHQLALESCFLQRSHIGTWSVTGRVKNISDETSSDIWVLVQVFGDHEEFVAFEETPLPINPLPSGQASPFKVILEGAFFLKRISVGFKNASGQPVSTEDKRKKREWVKSDSREERLGLPHESGERSGLVDLVASREETIVKKESEIPGDRLQSPEREVAPPVKYEISEERGDLERVSGGSVLLPFKPFESVKESPSVLAEEDAPLRRRESEKPPEQKTSEDYLVHGTEKLGEEVGAVLSSTEFACTEEKQAEGSQAIPSVFQEATRLLKDISQKTEEREGEEKTASSPSWIENFRDAVNTFYQTPHEIFPIWFEECRKKGEFHDSLHSLLTVLLHCRFDQGSNSSNPLENTQKLFHLMLQPNLLPEEIPLLEGTTFASSEAWRDLFQRALPKVKQIGSAILEKKRWNALDLERLIQVIPHVGIQNSRMAIQWIDELLPDIAEIDFSNAPITVEAGLYRVAARLGIVDPHLDYYHESNSMGDTKIQSFATKAFPHNPVRIEKPMMWIGSAEDQGGHCFPIQPGCTGCLFESFCPRLYLDIDPSEIGMRE